MGPSLHGANTAAAVLDCLTPEAHEVAAGAATHDASLLLHGSCLLSQLIAWWRASPADARPLHAHIAHQLVLSFTPRTAPSLDLDTLGLLISAAQLAPALGAGVSASSPDGVRQRVLAAQVRLAALRQAGADGFYAALPSDTLRTALLIALLRAAEGDGDDASRAEARRALEALPLSADVLIPILQAVVFAPPPGEDGQPAGGQSEQPKRKKGKKGEHTPLSTDARTSATVAPSTAAASAAQALPHAGSLPALMPLALGVLALELLQWKEHVARARALVPACQALVLQLLPVLDSIASAYDGEADPAAEMGDAPVEQPPQHDATVAAAAAPAPGGKSSLAGYAVQLALNLLEALARSLGGAGRPSELDGFDLELVVRAAREAPDAAVRNAALSELAVLAALKPQVVLSHVLQVRGGPGLAV